MVDLDLDSIRISLHVLAVSVWIGGQVVMAALVPVLRAAGPDVPSRGARRFARVAWPFFALAVVSGVWNLFEVDVTDRDTSYQAALAIKLLAVGVSGGAAAVHSLTDSPRLRAVTGGLGLTAALAALFLGVVLVT
ncbi:MAG: CopD family protein [Acidimicrobiales bacterium]